MNILDELRRDHERLRADMTALEAGAAGPEALGRFATALLGHAQLEDELLFGALAGDLPPDHGPLAVMRAEHREIEAGLARLAGPAAAAAPGELARLLGLARGHFQKEEVVLFAFAERLVDSGRLAALGAAFRERGGGRPPRVAPEVRVADLTREQPATIRVLQRHGVDFCCGGKRSLAEACERAGVAYQPLADELAAALAGPGAAGAEGWQGRTVVELVGHVLERFHSGLREELARLETMAERARERHGAGHPELAEVAAEVAALRREMVTHLEVEEHEIFPALLRGETAGVAERLRAAEAEHEGVGRHLANLRRLTAGYQPPPEACATWRGLFHGLAELERETHLHVHLENNVLFHRVAAGAEARTA